MIEPMSTTADIGAGSTHRDWLARTASTAGVDRTPRNSNRQDLMESMISPLSVHPPSPVDSWARTLRDRAVSPSCCLESSAHGPNPDALNSRKGKLLKSPPIGGFSEFSRRALKSLARFCCDFLNLQHLAESAFSKLDRPNEAQTRHGLPRVEACRRPRFSRWFPSGVTVSHVTSTH